MANLVRIVEILGGHRVLRRRIVSDEGLREAVLEGLSAQAALELAKRLNATIAALTEATAIDRRTFERRIAGGARLKADESDRVVRVAWIAARAMDVLGLEAGAGWLHQPNRAFGGRVPLTLLSTDVGTRMVEQALERIERKGPAA
ncbi:DUF2384 domain-containing protein [bacterium]|nr:MAG: DUF2384 domain-containing protein [bacterium]